MVSGLEGPAARAIERVGQKLFGTAKSRRAKKLLRRDARTLVPTGVAEDLLAELNEAETGRLSDYLTSPDFEEIAHQFVLGRLLNDVHWDELTVNIREELSHGLRHSAGLRPELLVTATDVVFGALAAAFSENSGVLQGHQLHQGTVAVAAHLTAAAAANSRLLSGLNNLADVHEFARQLRAQVAAVHGHMRLPHLGISRPVPYDQLYVEPVLRPKQDHVEAPNLAALALPGTRSVILGDPGAGKSTLAAKLAYDVASDRVPGAEGRVPFLLLLRNFAMLFRQGGKGLVHYLEQVCGDPYNLEPPPKAVDYLLRNGRAVVLLDGLDELIEPELRRKFVQLVDSFVNLYPLVPVLVTARPTGYSDVPLDHWLFTVSTISELSENQIHRYTERWFALDGSTAESEQARVAKSFLSESTDIAELRSNQLLLALLCAMYPSEGNVPSNLAQVYERCATTLFDRWDSTRGIAMPLQFKGRLRGAVQYLAWQMFLGEWSGKPLPRHRIVRILADYLEASKLDEDEALATAEQFVEFCTGRTWILTDVGATGTEPCYGFTPRAFLEYFAAEHLVRTHPTAPQLWQRLRPHLLSNGWEVVIQIALQLLSRKMDGGVDDLLRLALVEIPVDLHERSQLHQFAARAIGYVHPSHDVIAEVVTATLQASLEGEVRHRFHYWISNKNLNRTRPLDDALQTIMYHCAPKNLPEVRRAFTTILDDQIESGTETALFVLMHLSKSPNDRDGLAGRIWEEVCRDLRALHTATLAAWNERTPWAGILTDVQPDRMVIRFGPWSLYLAGVFLNSFNIPLAERLIRSCLLPENTNFDPTQLCDALIAAKRPWISDERWRERPDSIGYNFIFGYFPMRREMSEKPLLAPMALLALPYLEAGGSVAGKLLSSVPVPLLDALAETRSRRGVQMDLMGSLQDAELSEEVRAFLVAWALREFDVLGPQPAGLVLEDEEA